MPITPAQSGDISHAELILEQVIKDNLMLEAQITNLAYVDLYELETGTNTHMKINTLYFRGTLKGLDESIQIAAPILEDKTIVSITGSVIYTPNTGNGASHMSINAGWKGNTTYLAECWFENDYILIKARGSETVGKEMFVRVDYQVPEGD